MDYQDLLFNITQEKNILAALKHLNRSMYHVRLSLSDSLVEKVATAMQEPFPVLTRLFLTSEWDDYVPALPANFLGGSAPRLQAIGLCNIPYPALPTLLLSTNDLVKLHLRNIPRAGHISPEAMVASLAVLPKLEIFVMEFYCCDYRHDRIGPPPVTRIILPALAYFVFRGASEYLEDLVGRIDGPHLNYISITTYSPIVFQAAQLSRFIDQSVGKLAQCRNAEVSFLYRAVTFNFCHRPDDSGQDRTTVISYEGINWEDTQVLHQLPVTLQSGPCSDQVQPRYHHASGPEHSILSIDPPILCHADATYRIAALSVRCFYLRCFYLGTHHGGDDDRSVAIPRAALLRRILPTLRSS